MMLLIKYWLKILESCKKNNISFGTQIANPTEDNLKEDLYKGYIFIILCSDLFVLSSNAVNLDFSFTNKFMKSTYPMKELANISHAYLKIPKGYHNNLMIPFHW